MRGSRLKIGGYEDRSEIKSTISHKEHSYHTMRDEGGSWGAKSSKTPYSY